ncbi:DUF6713 family protein [Dysgonomonas capnocytophagoides]|uniref:DUF6713 family protein n=1 Tax=Dysgonomonas capnocytophagoides TaxID=45254 RepID=UPI0033654CBC
MPDNILFYSGLSLFLIHEMDAIRHKEWKMFPILSSLSDRLGYIIFTCLHIPLFIGIFWFLANASIREIFIKTFDIFMIIHLILHVIFLEHRENKFRNLFSWLIIIGISLCGCFDLILFR